MVRAKVSNFWPPAQIPYDRFRRLHAADRLGAMDSQNFRRPSLVMGVLEVRAGLYSLRRNSAGSEPFE